MEKWWEGVWAVRSRRTSRLSARRGEREKVRDRCLRLSRRLGSTALRPRYRLRSAQNDSCSLVRFEDGLKIRPTFFALPTAAFPLRALAPLPGAARAAEGEWAPTDCGRGHSTERRDRPMHRFRGDTIYPAACASNIRRLFSARRVSGGWPAYCSRKGKARLRKARGGKAKFSRRAWEQKGQEVSTEARENRQFTNHAYFKTACHPERNEGSLSDQNEVEGPRTT